MFQKILQCTLRSALCFLVLFCGLIAAGIDFHINTPNVHWRNITSNLKIFSQHFSISTLQPVKQNCLNIPSDETVDIAFITDEDYVLSAQTAIYSATVNKCPQSKYAIYVLTRDLNQKQKESFKKLETPTVSVTVVPVDAVALSVDRLLENSHVSKASLNKFFIADYLPDLKKVLYLDSDTLVMGDLTTLFQTDLGYNYFAAVRKKEEYKVMDGFVPNYSRVAPPFDFPYFNAGMLLMNLEAIRVEEVGKKAYEMRLRFDIPWSMDQEAFNGVSFGKVIFMPYKYNAMTHTFTTENMKKPFTRTLLKRLYEPAAGRKLPETPEEVFNEAVIIHYIAAPKIWNTMSDDFASWSVLKPLRKLWFSYAEKAEKKINAH